MPRCPECGVPDYADFRVVMHYTVIYHCSNCGHGWKRHRSVELDKDEPPRDEDVCIKYGTCLASVRECKEGLVHDPCFVNIDDEAQFTNMENT